ADLQADRRRAVDRQQFPETPHSVRPRLDLAAIQGLCDGIVIVIHLQWTEVLGAKIEGLLGILLATQATFQTAYKTWHCSVSFVLGHYQRLTPASAKRKQAAHKGGYRREVWERQEKSLFRV